MHIKHPGPAGDLRFAEPHRLYEQRRLAEKYWGRFQVRVTPELHRRLAMRAAEANVSLNRVVSDQLAKP